MAKGILYLVAVIDSHSWYVLSWSLFSTLDASFCIEELKERLRKVKLEIFNADKGSQLTVKEFTGIIKKYNIWTSMAGEIVIVVICLSQGFGH